MPERLTVPPELAGERADLGLANLLGVGRAETRRMLDDGRFTSGRKTLRPSTRLVAGVVDFGGPISPAETSDPSHDLVVVFIDRHLLVVDKPPGMVVHPVGGHRGATLVDSLLAKYPELAAVGERDRPGIVHRLDKDTSGLLVVARSQEAYLGLSGAIRQREVKRSYTALVHGRVHQGRGTIHAPLGRDPRRPSRQGVSVRGKPSVTHYRVAETWPQATLLDVELETGRTHQIRVHLAAIGHPVVGDRQYGRRTASVTGPRQFLHASRLGFVHPVGGESLSLEAALPPDLADVLAALGPGMKTDLG